MVTGEPVVCCDTSFLFALYATEVHTSTAVAEARRVERRLTVSSLNEFELANALRLAVFRRVLPMEHASDYLRDFRADVATGAITFMSCDLTAVIDEAKRLSATYTVAGGHRGFDVLHVAAALCLGAEEFFSFDARQRELAIAEGLAVAPPA